MNNYLTNVCGGVLPPISGEMDVTFPAKCKGQLVCSVTSLDVEFQSFSVCCTVDPEGNSGNSCQILFIFPKSDISLP